MTMGDGGWTCFFMDHNDGAIVVFIWGHLEFEYGNIWNDTKSWKFGSTPT